MPRLSLTRPAGISSEAHRRRFHAVVFTGPEEVLSAVRGLRGAGYDIANVHSPFPVHGLMEAMGVSESRIPWGTFVGGALGCTTAFVLQIWTHTTAWPLNIGGKSDLALPALVPVAFELTILFAAFATFFLLLGRAGLLPRFASGTPRLQPHLRVNDDRFVVLVAETDASFSRESFVAMCEELAPVEIIESWRVE